MGGCRESRVDGESSFAGGGGGAIVSGEVSPRGPRGSDSRSKSSNFEMTDWPRRDPVGRRRDVIGEACFLLDVALGVEVEACLCWAGVAREGCEDKSNSRDVANYKVFDDRRRVYQVEALKEFE